MRCARQLTLQFPSSWDLVIAGGFVAGVLLFAASSALQRSADRQDRRVKGNLAWPKLVDEEIQSADAALRLEMVERLSLVPGSWSRNVLERAQQEETDPNVRSAIERALAGP